jgi:hypothetical protein
MPAKTAPTADQLVQMIQQRNAGAPSATVVSEGTPQLGGQGVSPTTTANPIPDPGAPARPMQEMDEPAIPKGNPPVEAEVAEIAAPVAAPAAEPNAEMQELNRRLAALEEERSRERRIAKDREEEARIAALPPEQQTEAKLHRAEMRALEAELRAEEMTLKLTHPDGVAALAALAEDNDIEIDPASYRKAVMRFQEQHDASVIASLHTRQAQLDRQVQAQWGVRPSPEQSAPPPPTDPDIMTLKQARLDYRRHANDPEMMKRLKLATDQLLRRGLDPSQIV